MYPKKRIYFVKHGAIFAYHTRTSIMAMEIPAMFLCTSDYKNICCMWPQTRWRCKTNRQEGKIIKNNRWMSDQLAHFSFTAPLLCHLHVDKQYKHRNTHTHIMCQDIKLWFSNMTHSLQKTTFSQMCHLTELSFISALFSVKDSAPLFTTGRHIWLQAKTIQEYWNLLLENKDKRDVCVHWATFRLSPLESLTCI